MHNAAPSRGAPFERPPGEPVYSEASLVFLAVGRQNDMFNASKDRDRIERVGAVEVELEEHFSRDLTKAVSK